MRLLPILCIALALIACDAPKPRRPSPTLLQAHGLEESFRHHSTIESAVRYANRILESGASVRLHPSWLGEGAGMVPNSTSDGSFSLTLAVPVYAVDGDSLPERHIVFVPPGERCIIINTTRLPALFKMFALKRDGMEGLSIDETAVLAFVMLHEVGHLHYGDASSFVESAPLAVGDILAMKLSLDALKTGQATQNNRELRADVFALELIQSALKSSDAAIDASNLLMQLSKADWNRFGNRIWVHGTARHMLFSDGSYTHPNLELRLKVLGYLANPSKAAEENLRFFLEEREKTPDPSPLYRKE